MLNQVIQFWYSVCIIIFMTLNGYQLGSNCSEKLVKELGLSLLCWSYEVVEATCTIKWIGHRKILICNFHIVNLKFQVINGVLLDLGWFPLISHLHYQIKIIIIAKLCKLMQQELYIGNIHTHLYSGDWPKH